MTPPPPSLSSSPPSPSSPSSPAPVPLLCLPFAGAGASAFWPWTRLSAPGLTVVAVQLPGREDRLAEEPYRDAHRAADGLVPEVLQAVSDGAVPPAVFGPLAVFGHSFGALLAYELTRRLHARPDVTVAHLFVSGSAGPFDGRPHHVTGLPDDEFLARVAELADFHHPVFGDPDMRELLLPTLRADMELQETYRPASTEPLDVPITALRGSDDRIVSPAQAGRWRAATRAEFAQVDLPGGHMYLVDRPQAVLDTIAARLGSSVGWSAGSPVGSSSDSPVGSSAGSSVGEGR